MPKASVVCNAILVECLQIEAPVVRTAANSFYAKLCMNCLAYTERLDSSHGYTCCRVIEVVLPTNFLRLCSSIQFGGLTQFPVFPVHESTWCRPTLQPSSLSRSKSYYAFTILN